jgi:membrane complex biogenesis BtpA family protein
MLNGYLRSSLWECDIMSGWPFRSIYPIIGMVHLPPLPGSPKYGGNLSEILDFVRRDVLALQRGGVDGLMVENFGDAPFYRDRVPPETVSSIARALSVVAEVTKLPFGVNVLRNDSETAISLAYAFGGSFIRANILSEAYVTDQGIIEGNAASLMRLRRRLGAERVGVWADVHSKHASPLSSLSLKDSVADLFERSLADAVIITGRRTGLPPTTDDLHQATGFGRVIVGSGLTPENASDLVMHSDGAIVGTYLKREGKVQNEVDPERVSRLTSSVRSAVLRKSRRRSG